MQTEPAPFSGVIRFADFEVALRSHELRRGGRKVRLQEKSFQVLHALLRTPGRVVTREELVGALWPKDTFVDAEHGLNAAVRRLREALGDSADEPRFVETLPKLGYRFVGEIREAQASRDDRPVVLYRPPSSTAVGPPSARPAPDTQLAPAPVRRTRWVIPALAAALIAVAVSLLPALSRSRMLNVSTGGGTLAVGASSEGVDDLITRGRYLHNMKRFPEAHQFFEEALRIDPKSGKALGGLALAMTQEGHVEEGIATARRALGLDPTAADAYAVLAYWRWRSGDFEGAERYFRRAIESDPANGKMHNRLGRLLLDVGKVADAGEQVREARRLDPLNPDVFDVAMLYEAATGDIDGAERDADSWMRIWAMQVAEPSWTESTIVEVYALAGRYDEALALCRRLDPNDGLRVASILALQGRIEEARTTADTFVAQNPESEQPSAMLARIYASVGDFDRAYAYLDRLVDAREGYPLWLAFPSFAGLRADARWPALKIRLEREFVGGGVNPRAGLGPLPE
jgi:DNA-binding winged helix-turn-helix (wHTH) protein/Flp pilus assembly protein TadD